MADGRGDGIRLLRGQYWLTRVVFLRCLGFVYAAAYISAMRDVGALLGEEGLLPATRFMSRVERHLSHLTPWEKLLEVPTIFWFTPPTAQGLWWAAAIGAVVSCCVALRGAANVPAMALLWALYHSLVNVGQTWYSFGWESQLLETGFLAVFLVPWLSLSRFPRDSPASLVCVWGYRWLLFRVMLGAGLIKMRGDACWLDLTCMDYHYETQPNPNPLSRYLHHLPSGGWHKVEVLVNHIVELVIPWCLLLTRRPRCYSGCVQVLFQAALVASGNLSFLNWLTAVPAVFCFDDLHLARFFSQRVVRRAVDQLAATTELGEGLRKEKGGEPGKGGPEALAVPAPRKAGVGNEGGESDGGGSGVGDGGGFGGGGGDGCGDGVGTAVGASSFGSGSGSGSGSGLRPALGSRPALARSVSTLQWSSESEDVDEDVDEDEKERKKDNDYGNGHAAGASWKPTAIAELASSYGSRGQQRDALSVLRFRGRGGKDSQEKPPSKFPSPADLAADCEGRGGRGGPEKSPHPSSPSSAPVAGSWSGATAAAAASAPDGEDDSAPGAPGALGGGGCVCFSRWTGRFVAVRMTLRWARRALRWAADALLLVLVIKGSVPVVKNLAGVGGGQRMNTSFDSLRIVNTYGNFGTVTKTRGEVVLKGTKHPNPLDPAAEWKEYGFRCKPGDVNQRPCVISPLHYRLDWQMWFAAFQTYGHNPWLVNLVSKLLSEQDETRALAGSLLRHDPFSDPGAESDGGRGGGPPLFIKADLYLYEFTPPGQWFGSKANKDGEEQAASAKEATNSLPSSPSLPARSGGEGSGAVAAVDDDGRERGAWWTRRFVREYLPPVGLGNPSVREFLGSHGLE